MWHVFNMLGKLRNWERKGKLEIWIGSNDI